MATHKTCDGCGKVIPRDADKANLVATIPFKWHRFVLDVKMRVPPVNMGRAATPEKGVDICIACADAIRSELYTRFADVNPNVPLVTDPPESP